jgi:two-component system OmpR family sensor kinase
MRRRTRLPIRVRLTLQFAIGAAAVLTAIGAFVYVRTGADLLAATDAGLRSRADVIVADVRASGPSVASVTATLIEPDEAFAQVADGRTGSILQSSPIVEGQPLLPAPVIRSLARPQLFDRRLQGIDDITRVLAVPVEEASAGPAVVLVGSSLQDRRDEMLQLAATLAIGGPVALTVISWAGWLLAGAALRPVQRMQREAASVSDADLGRRLSSPPVDDEISQLAATLNSMLDRIQGSVERERRFVDNASHELRTPVAILKAELDLALSRARTPEELEAALRSASEETGHLTRLAEDLLVLSRARGGRLAVRREEVALDELLEGLARHFAARAASAGVRISVSAPPERVAVDPLRVRQALDDLLDNALRHTAAGGTIRLWAERGEGVVRIGVEDPGSGFVESFLPVAFEAFSRHGDGDPEGAGLGLAIVRAIAEAHGGTAEAANRPSGGASVTMVLADRA